MSAYDRMNGGDFRFPNSAAEAPAAASVNATHQAEEALTQQQTQAQPSQQELEEKWESFQHFMQISIGCKSKISKVDGKQVFDLIAWFHANFGYDWIGKHLFGDDSNHKEAFLQFLNCLERGAAKQLTEEYISDCLQLNRLSFEEFKRQAALENEAQTKPYSLLYYLGFGRCSDAIRGKMKRALESFEKEEIAVSTTNGLFARVPAPAPAPAADEFITQAPAPAPTAGAGGFTEAPPPLSQDFGVSPPETVLKESFHTSSDLNSMNGMNTGAPAPPPTAAVFSPNTFTPRPATATGASVLRTPATAGVTASTSLRPNHLTFSAQATPRSSSRFASTKADATPWKTPASFLPSNDEAARNARTPGGEDPLHQSVINIDQMDEAFVAEGKMSTEELMKLRKVTADPIFQNLHQPRQVEKDLAKIEDQTKEFFWQVGSDYLKSSVHEGRKQVVVALNHEIGLAKAEMGAYSRAKAQVDRNVDAVSVSVDRAIENEEHDAKEKVAQLNREWEEKDRRHKEELEEIERNHKEAERQHNRAVEKVKRVEGEKIATLRQKLTKTKESATTLKNNFTKSSEKLQKDNATRLALPLVRSKIDEAAYHLVEQAANLRNPTVYTDQGDKALVEELKTKFFQLLTLLEPSNEQALVQLAYDEIYGARL